jgi:hypothetical protein
MRCECGGAPIAPVLADVMDRAHPYGGIDPAGRPELARGGTCWIQPTHTVASIHHVSGEVAGNDVVQTETPMHLHTEKNVFRVGSFASCAPQPRHRSVVQIAVDCPRHTWKQIPLLLLTV